ncbi:hypothetical protein MKW98_019095, partial [Papaver atlanticum]
ILTAPSVHEDSSSNSDEGGSSTIGEKNSISSDENCSSTGDVKESSNGDEVEELQGAPLPRGTARPPQLNIRGRNINCQSTFIEP